MKKLFLISLFCIVLVLFLPIRGYPRTGDYPIGIFGLPEANFEELKKAGINSIFIRQDEIEKSKSLNLNKIYVIGVTPKNIKRGLDYAAIDKIIKSFKQAGETYSVYLGDDLKCKDKDIIENIRNRIGIKKGMVGVQKGIKCYPNDDIFIYHYPLMRRGISLAKMLKDQVRNVNLVHSKGNKLYLFVQTHPQFWYQEIVKLGGISKKALLYPDGQLVRMLIYYAVSTGADGFFLYNGKSLSGEDSKERLLGSAQAILEIRPLTQSVLSSKDIDFFKKDNIYGTIIRGDSHDIIFVFNSDIKSHYHPSVKPVQVKLNSIINIVKYKSVYKYSPLGSIPIFNKVEVPQDHALILTAFKGKVNIDTFKLDMKDLKLYSEILQSRAKKLSQNMGKRGVSVPEFKTDTKDLKEEIYALLSYIDNLNETKRDLWIKKSGRLPIDGDILNNMYWEKTLKQPVKGEVFNFYYD